MDKGPRHWRFLNSQTLQEFEMFDRVYVRVYSFSSKFKLINPKKFGFRANLSIEDPLISLIDIVNIDLDPLSAISYLPLYVSGAFVDLQKTFDTV